MPEIMHFKISIFICEQGTSSQIKAIIEKRNKFKIKIFKKSKHFIKPTGFSAFSGDRCTLQW